MTHIPQLPSVPFDSAPLKRVAILLHPRVVRALDLSFSVKAILAERGVEAATASVWGTSDVLDALHGADACITLGGDGSLLRAARMAAPLGVPLLGINLGKLGFLAEIEPGDLVERLPRIVEGNYWVEERMMIAAELVSDGAATGSYDCLNEVVVARRHLSRVVRVDVRIDGHQLTTYTGDGVLVATPTGSSAYSLAAGGPILHPEVRNLVLAPISAHLSLRSPLVLPETTEVHLTVHMDHEASASFDGQSDVELRSGDTIVVRVGPHVARFLRGQERTYFYHTLVHKLGIAH